MEVLAEVLGGYPRSASYRRALRALEEKGEEPLHAVWERLRTDILQVVGAQLGAGLYSVVDGMMDWHDMLRPFAEAWRNTSIGGLNRWFDNNFFYRVPVFVDLPDPKKPVWAPRVLQLRSDLAVEARIKIVLPGPYTFIKLSQNRTGRNDWELAETITEILAWEAEKAVKAGAVVVQVDEPFLADIDADPAEAERAAELLNKIFGAVAGAETRLAIPYNVPDEKVYKALENVKADYVVLDHADNPIKAQKLLEMQGALGSRGLGVGALQARNIYRDRYDIVRDIVEKAVKATGVERVLLTTSAWLDLIPLKYALEKTRLLAHYAERLSEGL